MLGSETFQNRAKDLYWIARNDQILAKETFQAEVSAFYLLLCTWLVYWRQSGLQPFQKQKSAWSSKE